MADQPILLQEGLVAAALISAAAAVMGVWIQGRNAAKQIRATVLSANRQKWIDSLREAVTTCLSCVWALKNHKYSVALDEESSEDTRKTRFEWEDTAREALFRLRLLLSPTIEVEERLYNIVSLLVSDMPPLIALRETEISGLLHTIVSREIEKMRQGL